MKKCLLLSSLLIILTACGDNEPPQLLENPSLDVPTTLELLKQNYTRTRLHATGAQGCIYSDETLDPIPETLSLTTPDDTLFSEPEGFTYERYFDPELYVVDKQNIIAVLIKETSNHIVRFFETNEHNVKVETQTRATLFTSNDGKRLELEFKQSQTLCAIASYETTGD